MNDATKGDEMSDKVKVVEATGIAFDADIDGHVVMTLCDGNKGVALARVRMRPDTARSIAETLTVVANGLEAKP